MAHYLGEEAELWIDASHETTNPSGCLEPAPMYIHLAGRERRRRTDTLFEEVEGMALSPKGIGNVIGPCLVGR